MRFSKVLAGLILSVVGASDSFASSLTEAFQEKNYFAESLFSSKIMAPAEKDLEEALTAEVLDDFEKEQIYDLNESEDPTLSLLWEEGAHSWLVYTSSNLPLEKFDTAQRFHGVLKNGGWDFGGGYSYLDSQSGQEVSASIALTYNFENLTSEFQSGVDSRADLSISQNFEHWQMGLGGYIFHQFSIEGREQQSLLEKLQIAGLGPQIGYRFSVKRQKWHLHWRGFREFSRDSHIAGWDLWMALSIPL